MDRGRGKGNDESGGSIVVAVPCIGCTDEDDDDCTSILLVWISPTFDGLVCDNGALLAANDVANSDEDDDDDGGGDITIGDS